MNDNTFKDEFSHTIIHNKKFFDEKGNAIKYAKPMPEKIEEEEEEIKYDQDEYAKQQYEKYN